MPSNTNIQMLKSAKLCQWFGFSQPNKVGTNSGSGR